MNDQLRCPNCGSTSIRSREAIYKTGTSTYSGQSNFGGASFGLTGKARPRIFFGGSSSSGTRQSVIAQEAAPSSYGSGVFLLIIGFTLFSIFPIFSSLSILLGGAWLYSSHRDNKNFENDWFCSKCGNWFVKSVAEVKGLHKLLVSQSDQLGALSKEIRLNPTKRVRVNKANKMLQLIDEMLATREKIDAIIHDGVGDTIDLEDDFRDEMAKIKEQALIVIKIAGLIDLLHRADAQRVAGNNKAEIKLLLGALRLIKVKLLPQSGRPQEAP